MKKKTIWLLAAAALVLCIPAGCKDSAQAHVPVPEATITPAVETSDAESAEPFTFADLSGLEFWFGSGAGAWCTVLSVSKDGAFEGEYHDSDIGLTYLCNFTGNLTEPEKVDDFTYSVKLKGLALEREPGQEEDRNGIHIIYTEPYGLDDAEELLFYLPGAPVEELPEAYVQWAGGYGHSLNSKLTFYGLYNVNGQQGYSSYRKTTLNDELASLEGKETYQKSRIGTEITSQAEMTEITLEVYQMWDGKLNEIWGRLKEQLNDTAMKTLTAEELEWIACKETAMREAGAEAAGGTLQSMLEYGAGAKLTKARVYELAKYFHPEEAETTEAESYRDVLLGKTQFLYAPDGEALQGMRIDSARKIFNAESEYAKISSFAAPDLDGDGEKEVVLAVTDVGNDMGGHLIFHRENGAVYCFRSSYRTFWSLKTDGTFRYSEPAGQEDGAAFVSFAEEGYTFEKLISATGDCYKFDYFMVDGREVPYAEYEAAMEQQAQKPEADWYDFTEANIKAIFLSGWR